jgi:hypothetical protein
MNLLQPEESRRRKEQDQQKNPEKNFQGAMKAGFSNTRRIRGDCGAKSFCLQEKCGASEE